MKWSEALYMVNKEGRLSEQEIDSLSAIPSIKDTIFQDYVKTYLFKPDEKFYHETAMPDGVVSTFQMNLTSELTKRTLALGFSYSQNHSILQGTINDSIHLVTDSPGWNNMIEMDILVKKRGGQFNPQYRRLSTYNGTFHDRIEQCLLHIKANYDKYALDIISGQYWDDKARDLSFM